nr:lytic polysaccharide monooxygenase [Pseudomonas sp. TH10]
MIRNKQSRLFRKLPLVAAIGMASLASMAIQQASAHGYIESPKSRAYMCRTNVNNDCGSVTYEPQSVEYTVTGRSDYNGIACTGPFTECGPADGKIASGGMSQFGELDIQTATRWGKSDIKPGLNTFTWHYSARHPIDYQEFYITKKIGIRTSP